MSRQNIKELVDKAKDAVSHLDEPYRTKAFEVVLTNLLQVPDAKMTPTEKSIENPKSVPPDLATVDVVMNNVDRTKYPVMFGLRRVFDRALCALFIARQEGIDGLTAPEISKILREKFRVAGTSPAVSMALMNSKHVDRTPLTTPSGGTGYKYKLMHSGEEYVSDIFKNPPVAQEGVSKKERPVSRNGASSSARGEGLKSRVSTMIEKGFFQQLKEPAETQQQLRDNGFPYDLESIRTTLVRLVREGKLRRVQEAKGDAQVYKYINP